MRNPGAETKGSRAETPKRKDSGYSAETSGSSGSDAEPKRRDFALSGRSTNTRTKDMSTLRYATPPRAAPVGCKAGKEQESVWRRMKETALVRLGKA